MATFRVTVQIGSLMTATPKEALASIKPLAAQTDAELNQLVAYAHGHGIDAPEINEWRKSLGHSACSIDRKS